MTRQLLCMIYLTICLSACSKQVSNPKPTLKSYVVHVSTIHKTLHFTGLIQPIGETALIAPLAAVIETMQYHYGQAVKKGQILFILNSTELQHQYSETLTGYLKAKDNYRIAHSKFMGTNQLWKAGLISKNNYLNEKSSLMVARITLMQDLRNLIELVEKTDDGQHDYLSKLSFAEFDKVRLALASKYNLIYVKSPRDGVLLYPPINDNATGPVKSGMSVKSNQVIGFIGDLSGIRIEISVPEVDISFVQPGMQAIIHGVTFGKHSLNGQVIAINAQASLRGSDGLPSFTAIIEVHELNQEQQEWIKIGTSAEITLTNESLDKLLIPIAAIKPQAGQNVVNVLAENGDITPHSVITGAVDVDKVVIDLGLNEGDVVMYE
jgi:HlyD family secretion protein